MPNTYELYYFLSSPKEHCLSFNFTSGVRLEGFRKYNNLGLHLFKENVEKKIIASQQCMPLLDLVSVGNGWLVGGSRFLSCD